MSSSTESDATRASGGSPIGRRDFLALAALGFTVGGASPFPGIGFTIASCNA